jgi:hypothetical protein
MSALPSAEALGYGVPSRCDGLHLRYQFDDFVIMSASPDL